MATGAPDELDALLGPPDAFDELDLAQLRRRKSYKWSAFAPDVLPAFVAEMDFALAPAVNEVLAEAIAAGDCGYAHDSALPEAFAAFARHRWAWEPDPARMIVVPDVMAGVARSIEILTDPGDRVVITPPVYGPFSRTIERLARVPVPVSVVADSGAWRLDLEAVESAFAAGCRAIVLCNPHNPTGAVSSAEELRALADLAARFGAGVVSDEVHGPLTLPGRRFTPLLSLGELPAVTVTSASKAWNVAGLKCAVVIAGNAAITRELTGLPVELRHPGHLGALAAEAAFTAAAAGDGWLEQVTHHLQRQHDRARLLLAAALPPIVIPRVDAGYLLWLDCRGLELGDCPADAFLDRGKVAVSPGLEFGPQGAGFVRLNIATSGMLLAEAVRRMRAALVSDSASGKGRL